MYYRNRIGEPGGLAEYRSYQDRRRHEQSVLGQRARDEERRRRRRQDEVEDEYEGHSGLF